MHKNTSTPIAYKFVKDKHMDIDHDIFNISPDVIGREEPARGIVDESLFQSSVTEWSIYGQEDSDMPLTIMNLTDFKPKQGSQKKRSQPMVVPPLALSVVIKHGSLMLLTWCVRSIAFTLPARLMNSSAFV